ncbi:glutathione S-transferase, partial [bacterium]|nr:glutathione S-transferase [bacterium]
GPWLFGQFSIADCMFAPVALRFKTYGIELSKTATHYMEFVLDNEKVRLWVEQAVMESEIIEMAEVGGITG